MVSFEFEVGQCRVEFSCDVPTFRIYTPETTLIIFVKDIERCMNMCSIYLPWDLPLNSPKITQVFHTVGVEIRAMDYRPPRRVLRSPSLRRKSKPTPLNERVSRKLTQNIWEKVVFVLSPTFVVYLHLSNHVYLWLYLASLNVQGSPDIPIWGNSSPQLLTLHRLVSIVTAVITITT